jgi:hypothetical protein
MKKPSRFNLLTEAIEADRYPLSPRIQVFCRILAMFGPIGPMPPLGPKSEQRDHWGADRDRGAVVIRRLAALRAAG